MEYLCIKFINVRLVVIKPEMIQQLVSICTHCFNSDCSTVGCLSFIYTVSGFHLIFPNQRVKFVVHFCHRSAFAIGSLLLRFKTAPELQDQRRKSEGSTEDEGRKNMAVVCDNTRKIRICFGGMRKFAYLCTQLANLQPITHHAYT